MSGLKPGWYPQEDGTQRYWDGKEWTEAVEPKKKQGLGCGAIALICIGLLVLSAVIGSIKGGGKDDPSEDPEITAYSIESTCQDLVKDRLKNPSTAEFSDEQRSVLGASGIVVAENAFGGKVTSSYRCTVDGDLVRLVELESR